MESYLLVLASLVLLIPIVMYLPIGITSKGKMIIIFGAIVVSSIGVYVNMTFSLWQTAGMLLLLIVAMTYLMGEKFEGLIFDQEGNDLTAYTREEPIKKVEDKDDLIHFIGKQRKQDEEDNQEKQQNQPEEASVVINQETLRKEEKQESDEIKGMNREDDFVDLEDMSFADTTEKIDQHQQIVPWDDEMDAHQEEHLLSAENEPDHVADVNIEQENIHSESFNPINKEDISIINESQPYGSLTNDEVAFLLNTDESMMSDDLSVHFMEDIESLLEDEDEKWQGAKDLIEEEPSIDPIINVLEEGGLPLIIDDIDEIQPSMKDDNAEEDKFTEYSLSEVIEPEELPTTNSDGAESEATSEKEDISLDEQLVREEDSYLYDDAERVNEFKEDAEGNKDTSSIDTKSDQIQAEVNLQSTPEQTALQGQLVETFYNQLKLAKVFYSEEDYEALIKGYLTDELPDQTYYQFSTLLIDHYIEKQKWEDLKQTLLELQRQFEKYPVLVKQIDFLYSAYCA